MSLKPLIDAMAHADAEALVRERLHTAWAFRLWASLVSRRRSARRALLESLALPSVYADLALQVERLAGSGRTSISDWRR